MTYICTHTYACIHMHAYICMHVRVFIHMHAYICMHTYAYKHMHAYISVSVSDIRTSLAIREIDKASVDSHTMHQ